jgi:hypothetical protein
VQPLAEIGDFVFEVDDPLRADQGHAGSHEFDDGSDVVEVRAAVATLPTVGPGWTHDAFAVQPAKEGRLNAEHVGGLADREERSAVFGHRGAAVPPAPRCWRRSARFGHDVVAAVGSRASSLVLASIGTPVLAPTAMSTRRGLACSRTGMRSLSTPSV